MVIKLKKFSRNIVIKLLVIGMICGFLGTIIFDVVEYIESNRGLERVTSNTYHETREFQDFLGYILQDIGNVVSGSGDLEYIREEKFLDDFNIEGNPFGYDRELRREYFDYKEANYQERKSEDFYIKGFREKNAETIQKSIDKHKEELEQNYRSILQRLQEYNGLYISAKGSKGSLQIGEPNNINGVYIYLKDGVLNHNVSGSIPRFYRFSGTELEFKMDKSLYAQKEKEWEEEKSEFLGKLQPLLLFMLISGFGIVYLIVVAGKKSCDDDIHLNWFDSIYVELMTLGAVGVSVGWLFIMERIYFTSIPRELKIAWVCVFILVFGTWLLSMVRRIKGKTILKNSMVFSVATFTWKMAKLFFRSFSRWAKNLPLGIRLIPTPKKVENYRRIMKGVEKIKNGDLHHKIKTSDDGIYHDIGESINNIADGLKSAVESEVKSQRLKTELISNVSHDIRTPLTSIINYVDILSKKEELSEEGERYVDILREKSNRLKVLTDNLFEVSKASSGDMPVEKSRVEVLSLVQQCMGELEEKISKTDLEFVLPDSKEQYYAYCDGRLMWRVFENLMGNIVKYSMDNSRVYIDIERVGGNIQITLKNISKYRLNVSSDELMERFSRGDESRSTEGSGLGLAIVKSLLEIQGGDLRLNIDGDLFKAIIYIPEDTNK